MTLNIRIFNPTTLKPDEFMKYPELINMNQFDAWNLKRPHNHYIPDKFIQAYPTKFKLPLQKLIDIIKTQKIHPKSIDAILSNFNRFTFPSLLFTGIQIKNLYGSENDINAFINKYYHYINWKINSRQLNEEQKIKFKKYIDWNSLCYTRDLTKRILKECKDYLDWKRIEICKTYTDISDNVLIK